MSSTAIDTMARGDLPADAAAFAGQDETARTALLALAAAASLTDELAVKLLRFAGLVAEHPESLVAAVHGCDFAIERGSEWCLASRVREQLLRLLLADSRLVAALHLRLQCLAESALAGETEMPMPRYLTEGAGWAYHGVFAAAGQDGIEECLRGYSQIAEMPQNGQQWLAARLAEQQVELGLLPADAIEIRFLRGIVRHRESETAGAKILLGVAESTERRREVALAAAIVAGEDIREGNPTLAEMRLSKSMEIAEAERMETHLAQTLHTLGDLIASRQGRGQEAEQMLRRSLEIGRRHGSLPAQIDVLRSLARLPHISSERARELVDESSRLRRELQSRDT